MRYSHIERLSPPWRTTASWDEANRIIRALVERQASRLGYAGSLASSVYLGLEIGFGFLDELCLETCPHCPDPCCLSASPWFDYRDLVFLHLNHMDIPPRQPVSTWKATCCYIRPRGCTLDRFNRPWICTWYMCAVQTANLRNRRIGQWKELSRIFSEMKARRKEMEDEFIRVITSSRAVKMLDNEQDGE